ncbi:hypothetical protein J3Q64DRAFT_1759106 [Phycomyces blakesleeanus]|uniref:Plasma membrane proteolipid 3 n=2 Tax=Phycomyces blakesleeanus TaxID=4837 RepID=A0A167KFH6_PHYB8|nr:hypothetical protein PHYBLDRAFT_151064 [Phycomyces blakesleeanus NRRL 1555(-)]OAD67979.1 hypothetical protein PHYBLDRAFT_151064 [Phycomyces blakesleeanus NRRL 1555(-)]|eukprot:XP_018286019.1 hypothetical protein PHYBLDRAFT_151064 [Phycomyces blakesleeanus NRRL 1555(-)]
MVNDFCLILIILLMPPLGIFLIDGCGVDFWINVCLTLLGYIPGHIHGFYVLLKSRERRQFEQTNTYIAIPPPNYGVAPPPYK